MAEATLDVIEPDETERSREGKKEHHCRRGSGTHKRVTLWLTVRKGRVDEIVDELLKYGRDELRIPKITSWMSLWAGFGWRRVAVVAHCYFGEEVELLQKVADLKHRYPEWVES